MPHNVKIYSRANRMFTSLKRKENCMEHNSTCKAFSEVTEMFHAGMQDSLDEYTMAVIQHFNCSDQL